MKVSVVIPCFNAERWLGEALASVRAQTRTVDELVVVDDASTDRSVEIATAYGARVVHQIPNQGGGAARNAGVRATTGDAVAFLDADDRWRPRHVEVVGGLLAGHPTAAAAFGSVQRFGTDQRLICGYVPASGVPEAVLVEAFRDWLHVPTGAIVRRSALVAIGGFDETERDAEDFDLWLRLAVDHRFVATAEVTADWRWHAAQRSATPQRQYAALYRYRRRFLDQLAEHGDAAVHASLESEFRAIWNGELHAALDGGDSTTLRAVVRRARLVPGVSWRRLAAWSVLARLPLPLLRRARHAKYAITSRRAQTQP